MQHLNRKIITSVGYSFAFAALCSLAVAPQAALADDTSEQQQKSDSAVSASSDKKVYSAPVANQKNETVYLFANPDGSVKSTEVSTTLKNAAGDKELADSSVLTDIENKESDSTYTGSGDGMVWDAAGENVYYTGNTDKQAPVSMTITYFLDGQKVSPDKLAGASGKLKIRCDYENNATFTATIKDKEETMKVPFTFITAMMFDNENFKNVEVTNGKLVDDGDRAIIVGYAVPGLQKSLGSMVDDFDIPDYFEVSADVTDFEMKSSLTIASSGLLSDINTDDINTDELEDSSKELKDAMGEILSGANELKSGLDKLADGAKSAKTATGKLVDGADQLAKGANQLKSGIGNKADTAKDGTLLGGINELKSGYDEQLLKPVKEATSTIKTTIEENKTNIAAAWEAVAGMDKALDALDESIKALPDDVEGSDLQAVGKQLSDMKEKLGNAQTSIASAKTMLQSLSTIDTASIEGDLQSAGGSLQELGASLGSAVEKLTPKATTDDDVAAALAFLSSAKDELTSAAGSLQSAAGALSALTLPSAEEIAGISATLADAESALSESNLAILNDSIDSIQQSMQKLDLTELKGEIKALKQHYPSLKAYIENTNPNAAMDELQTKLDTTVTGMEKLSQGLADEQSGLNELRKGASQLADGTNTLADGLKEYDKGMGTLADGTDAAATGTGKLADGLQQFNDEGISKISDLIDNDLVPFTDRLDALSKAAGEYNNFAGITEGTDGEVKFIIETDPISKED